MCKRLVIAVALAGFACPNLGSAQEAAKTAETFWIIPHSHWEGAVFKTRAGYLEEGLPNILKALQLLRTQPDYRFVLDQVAYVKPFLERYPEEAADFRKSVKEGRLELGLALNVMPDVNMPGGETFIRQVLYGKRFMHDALGVDVTSAWFIDTFGFHAQMPQLLRQAGYTSLWHQRGVDRASHPSEYLWEGIDGTRIPAFWFPYSYAIMYGSPKEMPAFRDFVKQRYAMLAPHSRGSHRAGPAGVDVGAPEPHQSPLIAAYNAQPDGGPRVRFGTPSEFERAMGHSDDWPVFKGELNPIFQGTYSSRIELKEWMRRSEYALTAAEKLSALCRVLGIEAPAFDAEALWDQVTFNQTHDLASGVMTDHVYDDTIWTYEIANRKAWAINDAMTDAIASRINTEGMEIPVVVFNLLGWERDDLVVAHVAATRPGVHSLSVVGPDGQEIPTQILESQRDHQGGLLDARIAFVAPKVPPLGYSVFEVRQHEEAPRETTTPPLGTLENANYTVRVDPITGAIVSVQSKATGKDLIAGPANVVARQQDKGDLWELKRGLDGGSKVAMTDVQTVPSAADAILSTAFGDKPGTMTSGSVFSEFSVTHPFDNGSITTTTRLVNGLRRIEMTTTLVNNEKYVHYWALFPTGIAGGKNVQEIPFGAMERPAGIEFPAQNWVEYGNAERGVALLNAGLPGNLVSDGTLMVSLMRSHNLGAYGFGGGYEPGMSSESGFQIGLPRTMRYALVPHDGTWSDAQVYRDGLEFNQPLLVRKVAPGAGRLPRRWSFATIDRPEVVLSALKPGKPGELVLRVYEATGQAVPNAKIDFEHQFATRIESASESNLLEVPTGPAVIENSRMQFALAPFQIKTFVLSLLPLPPARP